MIAPTRILVIGRSGQLATALAGAHWPDGTVVICWGRGEIDVQDAAGIQARVEKLRPAVIINAAAYTAVDKAESDAAAAFALNRDAPAHLATLGIPLIHISTDYVFDGNKSGAYVEDDPIAPLGVYGHSKAAGEHAVRERLAAHVILRTSWVFAPGGTNFVRTMLRLGRERPEVSVVNDQHGCPTYAPDLAQAIVTIAGALAAGKTNGFGTFHLSGSGPTTWYDFANAIFQRAATLGAPVPRVVRAIPTTAFPTPARRPANSVLECKRVATVYGVVLPLWTDALDCCLPLLLRNSGNCPGILEASLGRKMA